MRVVLVLLTVFVDAVKTQSKKEVPENPPNTEPHDLQGIVVSGGGS